jgi:molybdopterin molybdotransferase
VRPGKPTSFGTLSDGRRVLGLPGNPASALACAELFLKPIVRVMLGADPTVRLFSARTTTALSANGPREHWMRARLETGLDGMIAATPLTDQDSSLVTVFAEADALLRRGSGAPAVEAGGPVDVLRLERL